MWQRAALNVTKRIQENEIFLVKIRKEGCLLQLCVWENNRNGDIRPLVIWTGQTATLLIINRIQTNEMYLSELQMRYSLSPV